MSLGSHYGSPAAPQTSTRLLTGEERWNPLFNFPVLQHDRPCVPYPPLFFNPSHSLFMASADASAEELAHDDLCPVSGFRAH